MHYSCFSGTLNKAQFSYLSIMKLYKKIIIGLLITIILTLVILSTWVSSQLENSLPQLNGEQIIPTLTSSVVVERDQQGIVTIKAENRVDLAIATGFIHAQERFFQMDLLRRNSAGELSALFGNVALNHDKSVRQHRFRERANNIINQLPKEQLALLKAYTQGVNQGLSKLKSAPFEYLLLRQDPTPWQEQDSILTILSMYMDLQYRDGQRERSLGLMNAILGADVYAFLNPKGSIWDASIDGTQYTSSQMPQHAWPSASSAYLPCKKQDRTSKHIAHQNYQTDEFPGSNSWAVSGQLSSTGSAIIANDMHLGIRVPNTWFRASFEYFLDTTQQTNRKKIKVTGATLPGTPNIVIGSNGYIAWGFTNSYGDYNDVIILKTNDDATQYLTNSGYKKFTLHKQTIEVKGNSSEEVTIKETIWGPVIGKNHKGELLAYRWVAHDIEAVNLAATQLEHAKTVEQAFAIAAISGIPSQNMVVGDAQGNIGWTIMGPIPKKYGEIGDIPNYWHDDKNGWNGYLSPTEYPQIVNPIHNRLWTANARVVGGEMLEKIGNGGYAIGARAGQIRDDLFSLTKFNEKTLLNIGLDDRALFLKRWQEFLLSKVLTEQATIDNTNWQEVKSILRKEVSLTANIDSVAYRLVRNFRINIRNSVFSQFNETLINIDDEYKFRSIQHQIETPLWQLINEQPSNFLMLPTKNWQTLFAQALEKTIDDMVHYNVANTPEKTEQPLSAATWGQQNTTKIMHPLSNGVPFIAKWVDMPARALSGDSYMPRVQGKSFGASERMVVSPGHEENGIFHMPTSQSGHPWSPYYGKGHSDWEQGITSPFLPGNTVYTLMLNTH